MFRRWTISRKKAFSFAPAVPVACNDKCGIRKALFVHVSHSLPAILGCHLKILSLGITSDLSEDQSEELGVVEWRALYSEGKYEAVTRQYGVRIRKEECVMRDGTRRAPKGVN